MAYTFNDETLQALVTSVKDTIQKDALTQYTTMPEAAAKYANDVVQYIGTSTEAYAQGAFYKCVGAGDPVTYTWQKIGTAQVDSSLDASSSNAIANSAVAQNLLPLLPIAQSTLNALPDLSTYAGVDSYNITATAGESFSIKVDEILDNLASTSYLPAADDYGWDLSSPIAVGRYYKLTISKHPVSGAEPENGSIQVQELFSKDLPQRIGDLENSPAMFVIGSNINDPVRSKNNFTINKTPAEIKAAFDAGKMVVLAFGNNINGGYIPLKEYYYNNNTDYGFYFYGEVYSDIAVSSIALGEAGITYDGAWYLATDLNTVTENNFYITYTVTNISTAQSSGITRDKSNQEIKDAYDNGKNLIAIVKQQNQTPKYYLPLQNNNNYSFIFIRTDGGMTNSLEGQCIIDNIPSSGDTTNIQYNFNTQNFDPQVFFIHYTVTTSNGTTTVTRAEDYIDITDAYQYGATLIAKVSGGNGNLLCELPLINYNYSSNLTMLFSNADYSDIEYRGNYYIYAIYDVEYDNGPQDIRYIEKTAYLTQFYTIPTASFDNLGQIIQYMGSTGANYTNGYYYKCVRGGGMISTYSWEQFDVQPKELPTVTSSDNGKVLTVSNGAWDKATPESNVFTAKFTVTDISTAQTSGITCDKTLAELVAAYDAGKHIQAIITDSSDEIHLVAPLTYFDNTTTGGEVFNFTCYNLYNPETSYNEICGITWVTANNGTPSYWYRQENYNNEVWTGTQAQYDALTTKTATLYAIVESAPAVASLQSVNNLNAEFDDLTIQSEDGDTDELR